MKKLFLIGFWVFSILFSANLIAQDIECIIVEHSTEVAQLKKEIKKYVNQGYIPEGMTYDGNQLYFMYLNESEINLTEWILEWYDDTDELETGMDEHTSQGFIPAAITAMDDQIYVLFTMEEGVEISGYSFIPTSWETIEEDIEEDVNEGYIPVGIAVMNDGEYYVLMVTLEEVELSEWLVEEYETGEHQEAIDDKISDGFIPVGFEAGDEWVHVLYVKIR